MIFYGIFIDAQRFFNIEDHINGADLVIIVTQVLAIAHIVSRCISRLDIIVLGSHKLKPLGHRMLCRVR